MIQWKTGGRPRREPISYDRHIFANKAELNRYCELRLLEKAGEIHDLQCQVKFVLSEPVREAAAEGSKRLGKIILGGCSYIADFVYYEGSQMVVEDVKGYREDDYIVKIKWFYQKYNIIVKEVT